MLVHMKQQSAKVIAQHQTQQRQDFQQASSASDWRDFINQYQHNDPLKLVSKAEKNYQSTAEKERKERLILAEKKRKEEIRQAKIREQQRYPAAPAYRPGYTSCRTNCYNSQCYRTYADGRKVKFTAKQKWNYFDNRFEWDSGDC